MKNENIIVQMISDQTIEILLQVETEEIEEESEVETEDDEKILILN